MIKLRDLVVERDMANLSNILPRPTKWVRKPAWSVVSDFKITVATGQSVPTNAYYGSSQVYGDPGEVVTAKKGDFLVALPGGDFLVSDKRRKAWKIIKLGRAGSMGGMIPNEAPRSVVPKNSVNAIGDADEVGLEYQSWKSWIQGKK